MVEDIARRLRSRLRFLQNNYEFAVVISGVKRSLSTMLVSIKKIGSHENTKKCQMKFIARREDTFHASTWRADKRLIELFSNKHCVPIDGN